MILREKVQRFKSLSEALCLLIEGEGLAVRPYSQPTLPYFLRLSLAEQEETLQHLSDYLTVAEQVVAEHDSLRNTARFLEAAIKYWGFEADPVIYDYIADDVLVEIYNGRHTQIFRGLVFFEHASYTMEDFYCRPWFDLYEREGSVTQEILKIADELNAQGQMKTIELGIGEHLHIEKASLLRARSHVEVLCLSLIFKDGRPAALFSASRTRSQFADQSF